MYIMVKRTDKFVDLTRQQKQELEYLKVRHKKIDNLMAKKLERERRFLERERKKLLSAQKKLLSAQKRKHRKKFERTRADVLWHKRKENKNSILAVARLKKEYQYKLNANRQKIRKTQRPQTRPLKVERLEERPSKTQCTTRKKFKRGDYMYPTSYYKCYKMSGTDEEMVNHCFKKITNITLGEVLGEGTFGVVYKAYGMYRKRSVTFALKKMKEGTNVSFDEYAKEIEYHYLMDKTNIGPKIYDAFFAGKHDKEVHYVALEYFDMDVNILLSSNAHVSEKINAVKQMIILLKRQVKAGLDCSDIKPSNFLYDKNKRIVKITDFGGDFCRTIPIPVSNINDEYILFRNIFILYTVAQHSTKNVTVLEPIVIFLKKRSSSYFLYRLYRFLNRCQNNRTAFEWYTGHRVSEMSNLAFESAILQDLNKTNSN